MVGLHLTASGHASRAMVMPQRSVGVDMNLSQPNYRFINQLDFYYQL